MNVNITIIVPLTSMENEFTLNYRLRKKKIVQGNQDYKIYPAHKPNNSDNWNARRKKL